MDQEFLKLMDAIRERAGIPLVTNCAYRSREYDLSKGRSGNSMHTKGIAVDFRCLNCQTRLRIVQAALACGIKRIGQGETFVHIDIGDKRFGLPIALALYNNKGAWT
jgi:uncharacterized protein YcbK (DUF882 family)